MADRVDCVVIGAGVIGLAVARAVALAGREVLVLEAAATIGSETSSRNSEVIHAGIHYPKGSLKARFCVDGRDRLYAYCAERGIAAPRVGKLIVAIDADELTHLDTIAAQAADNGVNDLEYLDRDQVAGLEPALTCIGALLSPSTGIVDSHALMVSLQGDAEAAGAMFAFNAPVLSGEVRDGGFRLRVGGADPVEIDCAALVNAAGLHAVPVARRLAGLPADTLPQDHLCKGSYYALQGRAPFRRLIYPASRPGAAGLGVHVTLDLGGQVRFGPDIEWIDALDYNVDPARAQVFYAAIRRYWPGLPDGALQPGYAGIRPKITGPGEPAADFRIDGPAAHGIAGLVDLFGIESPGLTSSLAIGDYVQALLMR